MHFLKPFALFFALSFIPVFLQSQVRKQSFLIAPGGKIVPADVSVDFFPDLMNLEAPYPGGEEAKRLLDAQRSKQFSKLAHNEQAKKSATTPPTPWQGFQVDGNRVFEGVPNDNDLAISNAGKIVSVINSNVFMYDVVADSVTRQISLDAFSAALGNNQDKYDPRMRYDPRADRFVMVFLSGYTDTTNNVILAFSQTNDPLQGWNLYQLPGNPLANGTWTDYPIIALTEHELFITGNLLLTGQSWQTGFTQSIIWQTSLRNGYNGDSLNTQLWTGIAYGGNPIRNLCPAQGGSNTYGPNLYLLSDKNFSAGSDSIFIIEVTDTIGGNDTVLTDLKHADNPIAAAPLAKQRFNTFLETNDARILSAFYENNKIQFAGNSLNPDTNRACVFHGVLSDPGGARTITLQYIREDSMDFGYPNLSYTGTGSGDRSCILTFNHTSATLNPGFSAIYCDNNGAYSERLVLKSGLNFINVQTGSVERWGDYSGSQRKYNEPGKVWAAGTYGRTDRTHGTWISEIMNSEVIASRQISEEKVHHSVVYPNPVRESFTFEFELDQACNADISLFDSQGRLIRTFVHDRIKKGLNRFVMSADALEPGIYFLSLTSENNTRFTQKFIVAQ